MKLTLCEIKLFDKIKVTLMSIKVVHYTLNEEGALNIYLLRDNEHFIPAIDLFGSRSNLGHWIIGSGHFPLNEQKKEKLGKMHFILHELIEEKRKSCESN